MFQFRKYKILSLTGEYKLNTLGDYPMVAWVRHRNGVEAAVEFTFKTVRRYPHLTGFEDDFKHATSGDLPQDLLNLLVNTLVDKRHKEWKEEAERKKKTDKKAFQDHQKYLESTLFGTDLPNARVVKR